MASKLQNLSESIVQAVQELSAEVGAATMEGRDTQPAIELMQVLKGTHDHINGFVGGNGRRRNMAKAAPTTRRGRKPAVKNDGDDDNATPQRKRGGGRKAGSRNARKQTTAAATTSNGQADGEKPKRGGRRAGAGRKSMAKTNAAPKTGNTRGRGKKEGAANGRKTTRHYQRGPAGSFSNMNDYEPHLFEAALELGEARFIDWQNNMKERMEKAGVLKPGDVETTGQSPKPRFLANSGNLRTKWLKNGWIAPAADGKLALTDLGKQQARNASVSGNGKNASGSGTGSPRKSGGKKKQEQSVPAAA